MKTITISPQSDEVAALLEQAREEDLIVRTPDGEIFMLTAIDDFDWEIARVAECEADGLFRRAGAATATVPLDEVIRQVRWGDAVPIE